MYNHMQGPSLLVFTCQRYAGITINLCHAMVVCGMRVTGAENLHVKGNIVHTVQGVEVGKEDELAG